MFIEFKVISEGFIVSLILFVNKIFVLFFFKGFVELNGVVVIEVGGFVEVESKSGVLYIGIFYYGWIIFGVKLWLVMMDV